MIIPHLLTNSPADSIMLNTTYHIYFRKTMQYDRLICSKYSVKISFTYSRNFPIMMKVNIFFSPQSRLKFGEHWEIIKSLKRGLYCYVCE